MSLNKIFNLEKYKLVITTAMCTKHGISGHLFEMIEYWYYFKFMKGVNACILVSCDVSPEQFKVALEKYTFTDTEKSSILTNTFFAKEIYALVANNVLFVDGTINETHRPRILKAKHIFFLRCNNHGELNNADIVFQDSRMYEDLPNSVHYVKKFLFSKYKPLGNVENRCLLYLTSNVRMLNENVFNCIIEKYKNKRLLVISNEFKPYFKQDNIDFEFAPVHDIMNKFNEYIYTPLKSNHPYDCSPRFVTECAFYGKQVHYECPIYRGLDVRKYDIENNFKGLELTKDDNLCEMMNI